MRVVALGGGHGLAVTLTALRLVGVEPTAVVTVADDGGSSGRLRRDLGMLAPGDLRKAMLALADPAAEVRELFAYRFERGDLAGHNLGNLALAALTDLRGGFSEALEEASRWLGVHGQVLPATLEPVRLCGRVDGCQVEGQVAIMTASGRVESVLPTIWLYLTADPPQLLPSMLRLGRQSIDIAPGEANYTIGDAFTLPVDVEVHAIQPHSHQRARRMRGVVTTPDEARFRLLYWRNIDPDAANSRRVELGEHGVRCILIDVDDAAAPVHRGHRIEHAGIVAAIGARLDEHETRKAEPPRLVEIGLERRERRRVAQLLVDTAMGIAVGRPEHV